MHSPSWSIFGRNGAAGRYNIRGIPTLLVFKNGQMVEQIVGAVPKEQIIKALERHCAQPAPTQPAQ